MAMPSNDREHGCAQNLTAVCVSTASRLAQVVLGLRQTKAKVVLIQTLQSLSTCCCATGASPLLPLLPPIPLLSPPLSPLSYAAVSPSFPQPCTPSPLFGLCLSFITFAFMENTIWVVTALPLSLSWPSHPFYPTNIPIPPIFLSRQCSRLPGYSGKLRPWLWSDWLPILLGFNAFGDSEERTGKKGWNHFRPKPSLR